MTEEYRAGKISSIQPEPAFTDMRHFFLNRGTGPYGAMLGNPGRDLPLPTPVFLDAIQTGLQSEDATALSFYFGDVANFLDAEEITVVFDREGNPSAKIQGKAFPDTKVYMSMSFLFSSGDMVWSNEVDSTKLLLPAYSDWHLEKLLQKDSDVKLDTTNQFYVEMLDWPEVVPQIGMYPALEKVLKEIQGNDESSTLKDITGVVEKVFGQGWTSFAGPKRPTYLQDDVLKQYGVFYFRYRDSLVPSPTSLNNVVDNLKAHVPPVQELYTQAVKQFNQ